MVCTESAEPPVPVRLGNGVVRFSRYIGLRKATGLVCEGFGDDGNGERVWIKPEASGSETRRDVFEYTELFYNPKLKHTNNGMLSPVYYEKRQRKLKQADV